MSSHVLVTGDQGTGKTTVALELSALGYPVIHGDEQLVRTTEPGWRWSGDRLNFWLKGRSRVFVCGGAENEQDFYHLFAKVFVLQARPEVIEARMRKAGRNVTQSPSRYVGRGTFIDAGRNIRAVVFEILRG